MKKVVLSIAMLGLFSASSFASTVYTVLGQRTGPVTAGPGGVSADCDDNQSKNCFSYTVSSQQIQVGDPTVVTTFDSNGRPDATTYSGGWISIGKVPNGKLDTYTINLSNLRINR